MNYIHTHVIHIHYIHTHVIHTHYIHTHVINVDQITSAVHKSDCKSDCIDDLLSDNFKNATQHLFNIISLLFTAMLNHGVAPTGLLLLTLVPIPRNKRGNKCNSDNYRQIAMPLAVF